MTFIKTDNMDLCVTTHPQAPAPKTLDIIFTAFFLDNTPYIH
jgi:hypothetical protein